MSEWFRDWFASSDYLDVYLHRNNEDAKKLLNLIVSIVPLQKCSAILDAACGAGRHSMILASKGHKVTAFDLSKTLLRYAKEKSEQSNLDINFFVSDIRNVALKTEFDLIINLFTSFGYFDSDEENFSFIKDSMSLLKPKSYFVFDYFNETYLKENLVPYSERKIDGKKIFEKRYFKNNRIIKEITIDDNGRVSHFCESVRLYSSEDILQRFTKLGYKIYRLYGDYEGKEFSPYNAERLVAVFQK